MTARRSCILALGAAVLLAPAAAWAAPLPDPQQMISYSVVDQDLRDVLTGIVEQLDLRSSISPQIHGRVHGRLPPATAEKTLDRLAALYGFDWYCDGRTIFVSGYGEAVSKVEPLGPVAPDALVQTLNELGVSDNRWPLRVASVSGVAAVNGPPRYAIARRRNTDGTGAECEGRRDGSARLSRLGGKSMRTLHRHSSSRRRTTRRSFRQAARADGCLPCEWMNRSEHRRHTHGNGE